VRHARARGGSPLPSIDDPAPQHWTGRAGTLPSNHATANPALKLPCNQRAGNGLAPPSQAGRSLEQETDHERQQSLITDRKARVALNGIRASSRAQSHHCGTRVVHPLQLAVATGAPQARGHVQSCDRQQAVWLRPCGAPCGRRGAQRGAVHRATIRHPVKEGETNRESRLQGRADLGARHSRDLQRRRGPTARAWLIVTTS